MKNEEYVENLRKSLLESLEELNTLADRYCNSTPDCYNCPLNAEYDNAAVIIASKCLKIGIEELIDVGR